MVRSSPIACNARTACDDLTLQRFNASHGQIHWTENESQPPLWRADLWLLQIVRAKKLSAGHARPQRFATQAVRIRDCPRRKTETSLSIRTSGAPISADFSERAAQTRRDWRKTSSASGDATG